MMSNTKLPLYLRSNASKNIECGSIVVNPNIDFKLYKVLVVSNKHMLAIDENLVLYKFKTKNFLSVIYIFNINPDISIKKHLQSTTIKVSENLFDICIKNLGNSDYYEMLSNDDTYDINDKKVSINTRIIITKDRNKYNEEVKENDITTLDHYATIKLKDCDKKFHLSLYRNYVI